MILLFLGELNFWKSTVYYTFTYILIWTLKHFWEVKTGITIHFIDEETSSKKIVIWSNSFFILIQNFRVLSYFKRIYLFNTFYSD